MLVWQVYRANGLSNTIEGSNVKRLRTSGSTDGRWWVIDLIQNNTFFLFYDDRKFPARMKCALKDIWLHGDRWERVVSIDGVAITI